MSFEKDLPHVYLEDDILIIDYEDLLISGETIRLAAHKHINLTGKIQSKVMIIGEAAIDIKGEVREFSCSDQVCEITSAVALVPVSKVATVLAKIFMSVMTNPYPTKVFSCKEEAKEWLKSL